MSEEDQLKEYESQLADIEELLEADPTDESMLKLKSDLVELIALTKEDGGADEENDEPATEATNFEVPVPVTATETVVEVQSTDVEPAVAVAAATQSFSIPPAAAVTSGEEPLKKKLKKVKDFEAPAHLQVQEGDNEKEINRKKRAIKALKSKHRAKKIDYESTKKQQSWQNFSKKKGSKKKKSIFATQDGAHAKVGVVSGGSMTEYGERKRHKYDS